MTFKRTSPTTVVIHFDNGAHLGQFTRDVDGLWYWWAPDHTGCYPDYVLKRISDELWLMNRAEQDTECRPYEA